MHQHANKGRKKTGVMAAHANLFRGALDGGKQISAQAQTAIRRFSKIRGKMLKSFVASGGVLKQVAGPLVRRLGTALSGLLVGYGVAEPHASALVLALGAVLGVGFDICLAIAAKRSVVEKTIAKERAA